MKITGQTYRAGASRWLLWFSLSLALHALVLGPWWPVQPGREHDRPLVIHLRLLSQQPSDVMPTKPKQAKSSANLPKVTASRNLRPPPAAMLAKTRSRLEIPVQVPTQVTAITEHAGDLSEGKATQMKLAVSKKNPPPTPVRSIAAQLSNKTKLSDGRMSTEPLNQTLQHRILLRLQKHFYYPPMARLRGWQGKVTLSLTIEASGELSDIELNQSSGHTVIDRAALQSVARIKALEDLAALLHGRRIQLRLPVVYRLIAAAKEG